MIAQVGTTAWYKDMRKQMLEQITPLRIFYKVEGDLLIDGESFFFDGREGVGVIPQINIRMVSTKVKARTKKLKAKWEPLGYRPTDLA